MNLKPIFVLKPRKNRFEMRRSVRSTCMFALITVMIHPTMWKRSSRKLNSFKWRRFPLPTITAPEPMRPLPVLPRCMAFSIFQALKSMRSIVPRAFVCWGTISTGLMRSLMIWKENP